MTSVEVKFEMQTMKNALFDWDTSLSLTWSQHKNTERCSWYRHILHSNRFKWGLFFFFFTQWYECSNYALWKWPNVCGVIKTCRYAMSKGNPWKLCPNAATKREKCLNSLCALTNVAWLHVGLYLYMSGLYVSSVCVDVMWKNMRSPPFSRLDRNLSHVISSLENQFNLEIIDNLDMLVSSNTVIVYNKKAFIIYFECRLAQLDDWDLLFSNWLFLCHLKTNGEYNRPDTE